MIGTIDQLEFLFPLTLQSARAMTVTCEKAKSNGYAFLDTIEEQVSEIYLALSFNAMDAIEY